MNYEEMLAARQGGKSQFSRLFLGDYYREQIDGKWRGVVDIHPALNANITFAQALKKECDGNLAIASSHQIHFAGVTGSEGDIVRLELETGNYVTLAQFVDSNPSVVVNEPFLEQLFAGLADITTWLYDHGLYHVCFSPSSVFIRKGDNAPLLLSHGSYYLAVDNQQALYAGDAPFVAPEVLAHGTIDARCEVYSLGKMMEALFAKSEMPRGYRQAIRKATQPVAEDRYACVADFWKDIHRRRDTFRSVMMLAGAVVIAAICVALYFDSFPETSEIEYVKPAPRQATDDLLDDGFTPEQLGVVSADSASEVDWDAQRAFEAKAEEIFRKKYEAEADRVLSKIYNKNYMNNSEKKFMAGSESTIEELMQLQQQLGAESSLNPTRAQVIATEIIERITERKKKEMGSTNSRGVQLPENNGKK